MNFYIVSIRMTILIIFILNYVFTIDVNATEILEITPFRLRLHLIVIHLINHFNPFNLCTPKFG